MKKILFIVLFFVFSTFATAGILPFGVNYGFKIGTSMSNTKSIAVDGEKVKINSDTALSLSANAGIRLMKLRFELEYLYQNNIKKIPLENCNKKISSTSVVGNLYYNIIDLPIVKFFINGGLGNTHFTTVYLKNNDKLTYIAGLGVTLSALDIVSFDIGYRYINMGKFKIDGIDKKQHFYNNNIYVGIRFGF